MVSREYKEKYVYNKVKAECDMSPHDWEYVAFDSKKLDDKTLDKYYYNINNIVELAQKLDEIKNKPFRNLYNYLKKYLNGYFDNTKENQC